LSTRKVRIMIDFFPPRTGQVVKADSLRLAVRTQLRRSRQRRWALVGAPLLLASSMSMAQAVYSGPDGGDWSDAANWTPAAAPTAADTVTIDTGTVEVDGSAPVNAAAMNIG